MRRLEDRLAALAKESEEAERRQQAREQEQERLRAELARFKSEEGGSGTQAPTHREFIVYMEAPADSQTRIDVEKRLLVVTGEKRAPAEAGKILAGEGAKTAARTSTPRKYGRFQVAVPVPPGFALAQPRQGESPSYADGVWRYVFKETQA